MTINEVLERVSRLKPNAVEDRDVAFWLLRLDEQLFKELHMPKLVPISTYPDLVPDQKTEQDSDNEESTDSKIPSAELLVEFRRPKEWPRDKDIPLVAKAPYDYLYVLYATAMIEFFNREYNNYNNTILLYQQAVTEFRRAYRRTHHPEPKYIDTGGGINHYVPSADPLHV